MRTNIDIDDELLAHVAGAELARADPPLPHDDSDFDHLAEVSDLTVVRSSWN